MVWRPEQWPGLNTSVDELGRRTLSAGKPDYYFTGKTWAAGGSVELELPTQWFDGEDEAGDAIEHSLRAQLVEARAEIRKRG